MTWGFKLSELKRIHFEISNYCNLACPACARDNRIKHGQELNSEYMSLEMIRSRFMPKDLPSLKEITFSGNIDEPTIHPELPEILEWFCTNWPDAHVSISTNGSTRNTKFWQTLGEISSRSNFYTIFAIDGLRDTNHIYRIGSDWNKIERNFREYISSGGRAVWQFVVFDHNEHQIEEAKKLSLDEGFLKFNVRYSGRSQQEKTINVFSKGVATASSSVVCRSQHTVRTLAPSIFVNYKGDISPCCFQDVNHIFVRREQQDILSRVGGEFSYNLKYATLEEIIEGDYFDELSEVISTNSTCIKHCKENKVDSIVKYETLTNQLV